MEPYPYTTVSISATGEVSGYNTEGERYTETALELPSGAEPLYMVAIEGGTFRMGSPENEPERDSDESPQHTVTVPSFFMGQYEVTQAQYEAVMGENPTEGKARVWDGSKWVDDTQIPAKFLGDNKPVVGVSWDDAQEFVRRLNQQTGKTYRLPTEAEWEYSARAGTTTPFSYGDSITPSVVNYDGNFPYGNAPKGEYRAVTIEVNELYPNPWGLYHIHGNVWEWVQDQYQSSYANKPPNLVSDGSNPGITNSNVLAANNDPRVVRGGSWVSDAWYTRSANRVGYYRGIDGYGGFRLVLVP